MCTKQLWFISRLLKSFFISHTEEKALSGRLLRVVDTKVRELLSKSPQKRIKPSFFYRDAARWWCGVTIQSHAHCILIPASNNAGAEVSLSQNDVDFISRRDFEHYLLALLDFCSLTSPWWPLCLPTISAAAAHSQSLCLEIMCSCPIASWCLCWARTSTLHKSSPNVIKVLTSRIESTDTTQNILSNITKDCAADMCVF